MNDRPTVYVGTRTAVGVRVVADGQQLPPRHDLCNHSPDGFEFGYAGSGPAQLALALLADHLHRLPGDCAIARRAALRITPEVPELPPADADRLAVQLHQRFKAAVVARFDGDMFTLRSSDITAVLTRLAG
jgi:hypothetical protein